MAWALMNKNVEVWVFSDCGSDILESSLFFPWSRASRDCHGHFARRVKTIEPLTRIRDYRFDFGRLACEHGAVMETEVERHVVIYLTTRITTLYFRRFVRSLFAIYNSLVNEVRI